MKVKIIILCVFFNNLLFSVNYSEHISSIIYNNCTSCHRPNEIGAFLPLENYEDVFNAKESIPFAITGDEDDHLRHGNPTMPPWPPNREYSKFIGERYLEEDEIDLILEWIDIGAPQGDANLEAPIPEYPNGSSLGSPDIEFEMMESYFIEGNFEDDYRCFIFSLDNNEDISMSAIEFRPGNREAVHHAIITYVPHGVADNLDSEDSEYGYDCYGGFNLPISTALIGGYAPGLSVIEYPEGIGRSIPPNSDLIVQIHYAPLTHDAEDLSSINIFLNENPIERELKQFILTDWSFVLPPNQETTITNTIEVFNDISMTSVLPHCHRIGKSWEIYATTLSDEIIPIIKIDQWDFDWQSFYYPEYLLKIPEGSIITATCTYDNTSNNINNPSNPPQLVLPGQGTNDEMFFVPFEYVNYQEGDEEIYLGVINSILGDLNNDSIINIGDIIMIVNLILSNQYNLQGDINQDNSLDVSDIILTINIILDLSALN